MYSGVVAGTGEGKVQGPSGVFPRLRDNVLELGPAASERVLLPVGLGARFRELMADTRAHAAFDLTDAAEGLKIRWSPDEGHVFHAVTLPLTPWVGAPERGRFTFEFVLPGSRQVMARSLLVRSHPLGAPQRGVLLAARYTDPAEGEDAFMTSSRSERSDPWSDAWCRIPRVGEIVGVVVIDRLLHGDPLGRDHLAKRMREQLPLRRVSPNATENGRARAERHLRTALREWTADSDAEQTFDFLAAQVGLSAERFDEQERKRSDVVDTLGVLWLSRIAVDAPYRRRQADGVGQALVAEARSAVRRLPWNTRSIEVIRTIGYSTDQERSKVKLLLQSAEDADHKAEDFLTSAGYELAPEALRSSPTRPFDEAGNCSTNRVATKKLYYYTLTEAPTPRGDRVVTTSSMDRVFVPLAEGPYSWFADGLKTWELRRLRGAWSRRTVREGRRVELRRGYRDRSSSLWGTIREVQTAPSIEAFFDAVPYGRVIPLALSGSNAVEQSAAILGIDPDTVEVIGFRVELDAVDTVLELPAADDYRDAILKGTKTTTVRHGHRELPVGPARFVFKHSQSVPILIGRVAHITVADLDDKVARNDGFTDRRQLLAALRTHYPNLGHTDPVTVVSFGRLNT